MSILTKVELSGSNQTSFPDNTYGAITPQILRDYNQSVIDTLVDSLNTGSYAVTTGSNTFTQPNTFTSISASSFVSASKFYGDGNGITGITASIALPILDEGILQGYATSMNFSGSNISASVVAGTAVVSVNTNNLVNTSSFNSLTQSVNLFTQSINSYTASQDTKNTTLASYTGSNDTKWNNLASQSGSFAITTGTNRFTGSQIFTDISASSFIKGTYFQGGTAYVDNINSQLANSDITMFLPAAYKFAVSSSISVTGAVTASFFKGDGSALTNLPGTVPLTSLNSYTASQDTKNLAVSYSTSSLNQFTASTNTYTASNETKWTTLQSYTSSNNTNVSNLQFSSSVSWFKWDNIALQSGSWVTSAITASSLVTASVNLNTITFTKGNGTTFAITVNTGSGGGGSTDITALNAFTSSQLTINTAIGASTSSLNAYTSSNDTKWTTLGGQTGSYITSAQTSSMSVATASVALAVSTSISTQNLQHFVTFTDSSTNAQNIYVDGGIKYNPNQDLLLVNNITSSGYISASSLNLSGTLTASLQTGYVWVGNSGNVSTIVATSSFASSINTGSFATTGSNSFIGTEIITGSLIVSSSTTPLIVSGNITQQGAFSFILSGSTSKVTINQNSVTVTSGSVVGAQTLATLSRTVGISHTSASNQIGIQSNANALGSYGPYPIIFVTSGSNSVTYNPIQFQNATSYTDGRTTFTTPIQALAGEEVTGSLSVSGSNTLIGTKTITGSVFISGSKTIIGTNTVTGSMITTGSFILTGSAQGNVVSMSIASNTASMDFNAGNYFELTASVSPLNINVINLSKGTTSTLSISGSTASTITFSPNVLQPTGSAYTASVSGQTDILSFVAFNNSKVNVVSTLKMI